jgi:hypothetical protein
VLCREDEFCSKIGVVDVSSGDFRVQLRIGIFPFLSQQCLISEERQRLMDEEASKLSSCCFQDRHSAAFKARRYLALFCAVKYEVEDAPGIRDAAFLFGASILERLSRLLWEAVEELEREKDGDDLQADMVDLGVLYYAISDILAELDCGRLQLLLVGQLLGQVKDIY